MRGTFVCDMRTSPHQAASLRPPVVPDGGSTPCLGRSRPEGRAQGQLTVTPSEHANVQNCKPSLILRVCTALPVKFACFT